MHPLIDSTLASAGSHTFRDIVHRAGGGLRCDGIVVNLDRFADVETGVDRLLRYRRACPSRFVVLASAGAAADDLGQHRRAICDSTLRLPLTEARLAAALDAALLNHRSLVR